MLNLKRNILKLYYFCQNDINCDNNKIILIVSESTNKAARETVCRPASSIYTVTSWPQSPCLQNGDHNTSLAR